MSVRNLAAGRSRQKARTRREIVAAAQRLRESRESFTLDQVAEEAEMSRATVYRYFSSVSALNVELGLAIQMKTAEELFDDEDRDPLPRMLRLHEHLFDLVRGNEPEFRAFIKSTMDQWEKRGAGAREPLRGGRRVALVESALADLEATLEPAEFRKLVQSVSLLTFMEAFVVLKDVFHLEGDEADEVIRWAITRMLAGLGESTKERKSS